MEHRIALLLGAGGAKFAYHAGALAAIREQHPEILESPHRIAGVSAGGLVAAMLAQGPDHVPVLEEMALRVREEHIHQRNTRINAAWNVLAGNTALYQHRPLRRLIGDYIKPDRFLWPGRVSVGAVKAETGEYEVHYATEEDFLDAVWGSASMPFAWPPVPFRGYHLTDGGQRSMVPVDDVLADDPDELVIITLGPGSLARQPVASVLANGTRALAVMMNQITRADLDGPIRVNRLIERAAKQGYELRREDGRPYKWFRLTVCAPTTDLGDTLDFSRITQKARLERGYQDMLQTLRARELAFGGDD